MMMMMMMMMSAHLSNAGTQGTVSKRMDKSSNFPDDLVWASF